MKIKLSHDNTEIEFEAANALNKPISELILAILNGANSTGWWHLEPAGYYFRFTQSGSKLSVEVLYSKNSTESVLHFCCARQPLRSTNPFLPALRQFKTLNHREPNWPAAEFNKIESIELRLKKLTRNPV